MQPLHPFPPRVPVAFTATKATVLAHKVKELQQPEMILAAVDKYLDFEASDSIQRRTTVSTLLMSTPILTGFAANSLNLANSCMAGTQSFSSLSCSSAAASLAGVAMGAGEMIIGIVNLKKQATHLAMKRRQIDEELLLKLIFPPNVDQLLGAHPITEFSELSDVDKKVFREDLRTDVAQFVPPR